jgi:hypothetical protein
MTDSQTWNRRNGRATRSTTELLRDLSDEVRRLLRAELSLAGQELRQQSRQAGIGVGAFGLAGIATLYGVAALLAAAALALAIVLPGWLAALIVGVVVLLVAGASALLGKRKVRRAMPPMDERLTSVKQDVWLARREIQR